MLRLFLGMVLVSATLFGIDLKMLGMNKDQTIHFLKNSSEADLWDIFLEGQAQMLTPLNREQMRESGVWERAENVLEVGCGSGDFLALLHKNSPNKSYVGFDIEDNSIDRAKDRYSSLRIGFSVGDAETYQTRFEGFFDLVIFRYTLQHLKNPTRALEIASKYLKPRGFVYIMEAYDPANGCSHPLSAVEEALESVASVQEGVSSTGDRYVSLKVMRDLEKSAGPLSNFFRIAGSNLSSVGEQVRPASIVKGSDILKRHLLLFGALVAKRYGVFVDLVRHCEEVVNFSSDPSSWFRFGIHHMSLQKRG